MRMIRNETISRYRARIGLNFGFGAMGYIHTRTYEKELSEAKQRYTEAAKEHKELVSHLEEQD